jgi:ribulose-5-phosphate 4-epimerase/fuculose-1-phosphate aldolase
MKNISDTYMAEFIAGARRVAEYGLVVCSSGNLSWRVGDGLMLITTTDSWMARLTRDDVAVCRIDDGSNVGQNKPSKESGFHAGIFRERPEVDVVLHFNSPYATAIACRPEPWDDFSVIPEIPYYIGPVGSVPFLNPGSAKLAQAITAEMKEHDMIMLRNHGQVVVAKDFDGVVAKGTFFEMACKIIVTGGEQVQPMPTDAAAELQRQGREHRAKQSS